jgi:hypothetical protein
MTVPTSAKPSTSELQIPQLSGASSSDDSNLEAVVEDITDREEDAEYRKEI